MTVECISHKDLLSYLSSERYLHSEVLPISRHRGISHFQNPKANPNDIVLINIYEKKKLIAYLGLLSDDIYYDSQKIHVGWLSCMWVSPTSRGKGLAKLLLKTAWEKWQHHLMVTDFTPSAGALYQKTGYFKTLSSRKGIKCYNRLNLATFLPKKNKNWKLISLPLHAIDLVFNTIFSLKKSIFNTKKHLQYNIQIVPQINPDSLLFIQSLQSRTLIKKEKIDFDWFQKHPWLKNTEDAKADQIRYYFSSFAERYELINLKITKDKKIIGFLILMIRDDALKIPFTFFDYEDDILATEIVDYTLRLMQKEKLSTIAISNPALTSCFLRRKSNFFLIRTFEKNHLISKDIEKEDLNHAIVIHDGDGDSAFT